MRSMTGFGAARFELDGQPMAVEARSVNHRSLDVRVHLPSSLTFAEPSVRAAVRSRVRRGRVDVHVTAVAGDDALGEVVVHTALARSLVASARHLVRELAPDEAVPMATLVTWALQFPGVVVQAPRQRDQDQARRALVAGVEAALDALVRAREREGETLRRDIEGRIERVASLVDALAPLVAEQPRLVFERLQARLEAWQGDGARLVEPERLAQEVALLADRADATEELTRLRGHIDHFRGLLARDDGEPVGKQLQFIAQELHRETTTMAAKAVDARIRRITVEIRSEIERIREQLANVE